MAPLHPTETTFLINVITDDAIVSAVLFLCGQHNGRADIRDYTEALSQRNALIVAGQEV